MTDNELIELLTELAEKDLVGKDLDIHPAKIAADELKNLYEIRSIYQKLMMEVCTKFEGESRSETALRYIKQAEGGYNVAEAKG